MVTAQFQNGLSDSPATGVTSAGAMQHFNESCKKTLTMLTKHTTPIIKPPAAKVKRRPVRCMCQVNIYNVHETPSATVKI